jgi:diguanylate cyclase (GGDEF)-like protein
MMVNFVRKQLGSDGVTELLQLVGETRSVEELCDESTWSSYARFRRLMEAAAVLLGGIEALDAMGSSAYDDIPLGETTEMLQAFGSPEGLMANVAISGATMAPVVSLEPSEVGPREWLIHQTFLGDAAPFKEFCAFSTGMYRVIPNVFGFPLADVVEEQCQCDGAPSCVMRVRWEPVDEMTRQAHYFEGRVLVLESRLKEFQKTVRNLVSGDGLETVLAQTLASAGQAVQAPAFVLALNADTVSAQHVYTVGLEPEEAERIGTELLNDDGSRPESWLVVDVTSTRHAHGKLAAIRPGGAFLPQERPNLQTYGQFAAAALDSASALDEARRQEQEANRQAQEARRHEQEANRQTEEARRQGATARTLLELSTALAEITSVDEMAAKLVRVVPGIVGCDQAIVALAEPGGSRARIAAQMGFSPELDAVMRSETFPVPTDWTTRVNFRDATAEPAGSIARTFMTKTHVSAWLSVPIVVDGAWAGAIVVIESDETQLRDSADVDERLRGLAAQASTAVRNAWLLDQIRHQAFHDPLTGLPNRALILDRVEQMLVRARRQGHPAALMFIDLDGFKDINDTFGHATGDQLLRAVTARLQATLRQMDTIGRLGGDEFVVLADGGSVDVGPELVAERLLAVLREPFHLEDETSGPVSITASIGIAAGDRPTAGELLRDADIALYQAKAAGKACFLVFDPQMQTAIQDRLLLQMDLQHAIEHNEFFLVFQPIFTLGTGEVNSAEALIRWQHPARGEIQPDTFIPMLEETGLIMDVGRWVLVEACNAAASWTSDGTPLSIAVNVSARQLQDDQFLDDIRNALISSGIDPARLVLEITETAIMTDMYATTRRLRTIKELGIRIAIDDFGTGYSSLAYLREFPVDTLKIDRAFVAALGESGESRALVHTLVQLGKTLGLETVAEGIEQADQYEQLESEHCDSGQGFLIARPLSATALQEFLHAREAIKHGRHPASADNGVAQR